MNGGTAEKSADKAENGAAEAEKSADESGGADGDMTEAGTVANNQDSRSMRQYISSHFEEAMEKGWLQVYYQPIVRGINGAVCGAEALARWIDPVNGSISPAPFIPVLEQDGRIYQLDLQMLQWVCEDIRERIRQDGTLMPISLNLSRKDFARADFLERFEFQVRECGIPHDLLNIEITESAFAEDTAMFGAVVEKLHQNGYQVWMDDFGTGYSSLATLKDYDFDVIKIDMSFLSSASEKSKRIIESVVRMAKAIGIQTLAEGVESKVQYEYLRRIGCEKMQGYYFGHPMPKKEIDRHCGQAAVSLEPISWRYYYDQLGRIDYLTDEPLEIVEDDGKTMRILFANRPFREVLERDGVDSVHAWEDMISNPGSVVGTFHRTLADRYLRGKTPSYSIVYPSGDHLMQLRGSVIARMETRYLYRISMQDMQMAPEEDDQRRMNYLRNLYYFCNDIAIYDFRKNTVEGLKSSLPDQPIGKQGKISDMQTVADIWSRDFVYPPDRERYRSFCNLTYLRERMRQNKTDMLSGYFRSKTGRGDYQWLLHLILPVPKTDFTQLLYITIQTGLDEKVLSNLLRENAAHDVTPVVLWNNLIANSHGMFFWKDKERRFLGASQSFLDYYGLDSVREILGKTDEDMHWHVEPEPFRRDELDVLEQGRVIRGAMGECIIRGTLHHIVAYKMPIYRDGAIVGLIGYFCDAEDYAEEQARNRRLTLIDPITGLFSSRGVMESLSGYLEELWRGGTNFAICQVFLHEYDLFRRLYGEDAGNALLVRVGETIEKICGNNAVIGRIADSQFFLLLQYRHKSEIREMAERIRTAIGNIHAVGTWRVTCTADVSYAFATEETIGEDMYSTMILRVMKELQNRTA